MGNTDSIEFSVVIPLFNKKPFIRGTLETVLAQNHQFFEVIIVDDGSTDGSVDEIQDLLGSKVRLVRQQNSGPGAARNRGFAESRFDWVALLDADDRWMSDHLSTLACLVSTFPAADAVVTAFKRSRWQQPMERTRQAPDQARGYLLNYFREAGIREAVWTSCVAIRRDAFAQTSGFGHFWPGEDSEFWARLALDHPFAATRKITAYYTIETGGLIDSGDTSGIKEAEASKQGLFGTLENALSEPRYERLHEDIRFYRDKLLARLAKQDLYAANTSHARKWLSQVEDKWRLDVSFLRLLACFPKWLVLTGVSAYKGIKHAGRGCQR
ncbi:MAG: glycosyltransferase [Pseudomonadota bacterium]|nr:glycosyltransferase [Pseudomonadota bacterium]